jgi:hypothetical protein
MEDLEVNGKILKWILRLGEVCRHSSGSRYGPGYGYGFGGHGNKPSGSIKVDKFSD